MASVLNESPTTRVQTLIDRAGPHATKVMAGAAVAGLLATLLPAVTLTLSFLGTTASESVGVWRDWRGKLDLLAYLGVGGMAVLMLRKPELDAKKLSLACLVTSGVALLLAVWLPVSVRGSVPTEIGSLSIGLGCYLNVLAALVLTAASALQAKRTNVFGA